MRSNFNKDNFEDVIDQCASELRIVMLTKAMIKCRKLPMKNAKKYWEEILWRTSVTKTRPSWIKPEPGTIRFEKDGKWSKKYLTDEYLNNDKLIPA